MRAPSGPFFPQTPWAQVNPPGLLWGRGAEVSWPVKAPHRLSAPPPRNERAPFSQAPGPGGGEGTSSPDPRALLRVGSGESGRPGLRWPQIHSALEALV